MSARDILISCVLPTFNRAIYLPLVLKALARQTLPQHQYEIVVVDDGSTDDTFDVLQHLKSEIRNITVVRQQQSGIAVAKNRGVAEARGNIILFVDDDDVAAPSLLEEHWKAHLAHPEVSAAILGRTEIALLEPITPLMVYVTEIGCQLFSYKYLNAANEYGYKEFWGGRSSCKAILLENMWFDPNFKFGCEDVELGYRLRERSLKVWYWPSALSTMVRKIDLEGFCRRSYRQGVAQKTFHDKYPKNDDIAAYCEMDGLKHERIARLQGIGSQRLLTRKLEAAVDLQSYANNETVAPLSEALNAAYGRLFSLYRMAGIESYAPPE